MDFFQRIERELDLPPAEKEQAIKELRAHFQDIRDDLISKGASVDDAENEAARKLGNPESIAIGLGAVYMRQGWKSVMLSVLPFFAAIPVLMMSQGIRMNAQYSDDISFDINRFIVLTGGALLISFGLAAFIMGMRELLQDRRPAWLAPFLAMAILWPLGFLVNLEAPLALTTSHYKADDSYYHYGSPYKGLIFFWLFFWPMISSGLMIACVWIRARKWILLVTSSVVTGVVLVLLMKYSPMAAPLLVPLMLLATAGLVVFSQHPHSVPSRASLLSFVWYVLAIMIFAGFCLLTRC